MEKRHESDYDDFLIFTKEEIEPLFTEAIDLNSKIKELLNI